MMREIITPGLQNALEPRPLKALIIAFRMLMLADPNERHFSIKFCNRNGWNGLEAWCMIDEYAESEGGLTATFLLPSEY